MKFLNSRSPLARWVLGAGVLVYALLLILAGSGWTVWRRGEWSNLELAAFLAWWLLAAAAPLVHKLDKCCNGAGIYHARKLTEDSQPDHLTAEQRSLTVVPNILTRQAIHSAITLGVLAVLIDKWWSVAPRAAGGGIDLVRVTESPAASAVVLAAAALGFSIIATLVAGLCFDHSIRLATRDKRIPRVTRRLRSTGRKLDTLGWYAMMLGLVGITSLAGGRLCIATALVVFVVVWFYYFSRPEDISVETCPAGGAAAAGSCGDKE